MKKGLFIFAFCFLFFSLSPLVVRASDTLSDSDKGTMSNCLYITYGLIDPDGNGCDTLRELKFTCARGDKFVIIQQPSERAGAWSYEGDYLVTTKRAIEKYLSSYYPYLHVSSAEAMELGREPDPTFREYWSTLVNDNEVGTMHVTLKDYDCSTSKDKSTGKWYISSISSSPKLIIEDYITGEYGFRHEASRNNWNWFVDGSIEYVQSSLGIGVYGNYPSSDPDYLVPWTSVSAPYDLWTLPFTDDWDNWKGSQSSGIWDYYRDGIDSQYLNPAQSDFSPDSFDKWTYNDHLENIDFKVEYDYDNSGWISKVYLVPSPATVDYINNDPRFTNKNNLRFEYYYKYGAFSRYTIVKKHTFKDCEIVGSDPLYSQIVTGTKTVNSADLTIVLYDSEDPTRSILDRNSFASLFPDLASQDSSVFSSEHEKDSFNNQVKQRFDKTLFHKFMELEFHVRLNYSGSVSHWYNFKYNNLSIADGTGKNMGVYTSNNGGVENWDIDDDYNVDHGNDLYDSDLGEDGTLTPSSDSGFFTWLFNKIGFARIGEVVTQFFNSIMAMLQSLLNGMGQIPLVIGKVFVWLPDWFITLFSCGLGLVVIFRIIGR